VKIEKTAIVRTADGWEQEVKYEVGPKVRREIFVGRTQDELTKVREWMLKNF
jgi:hypothetical protein